MKTWRSIAIEWIEIMVFVPFLLVLMAILEAFEWFSHRENERPVCYPRPPGAPVIEGKTEYIPPYWRKG